MRVEGRRNVSDVPGLSSPSTRSGCGRGSWREEEGETRWDEGEVGDIGEGEGKEISQRQTKL